MSIYVNLNIFQLVCHANDAGSIAVSSKTSRHFITIQNQIGKNL